MNNTYQLSQSGIERLERFKRDIEAGDFYVRPERVSQSDIEPMYFVVSSKNGSNCAFTSDESKVVELTLKDIDASISGEVKREVRCWGAYYRTKGLYGVALNRSDITTPAQRSLDALGKKLQDRSKVYE